MGKTIRFNENGLIAIKKRLNEVMVGIGDASHNDIVTLWHGTDIPGIVGILKSGTICAIDGVQHGETYGMNWFSLKKVNNFNKGIVFSIEVPSSEFKTKFKMMNSSEAITRDDRFDISQYNLKIEMFCTFGREQLNRYYNLIVEKGEHYPIETIRDEVFYKWCEKSGNEDVYMSTSDYDLGLILSNILGEDKVRAEGFLEENTNLNGAAPEVDEYTIGGEEKDGENVAGGNYFHVAESIDFDNNGMSINDDKILGKYNLKDLILSKTGNYVTLNKIIANELGKGSGSRFMEELTRVADKNGWTLALTPDTSFGGSSVDRLKKFYKRFGFVPNKGRSTDFNTRESMIRKPCELKKNIIIPENRLIALKENLEPEVSSSEVDLSSFKKRDSLPPGIWKDEETLSSKVRLKLLDIADDFWEFVNLTWVEPKGIVIVGSICNYNWSSSSDIDLHLIVDFSEIDNKTEFVKQYLDSKKNEWNNEHEGLKIMGFPVELYVQDISENPEAGGIYDLEENKWVRKPNPGNIKTIGLNKFNIKDKAAEIMTIIDDMYKVLDTATDGHVIDKIGEDAGYLWKKVKDLRKKSLDKNGESGAGNIVYKVLRRTGYLDKLFKLSTKVYDRTNSITENKEVLNEFLEKDHNIFLYQYFTWADKASDRDKVEDLFYHCPYIMSEYLSDVSGYDEELSDLEDELTNNSDLEYDDDFIERLLDVLERHHLLRGLLNNPYNYADVEELPAWFTMSFIRIVKNEWCIHFTEDADSIAKNGFTGGTEEIENLAYTGAGRQKRGEGYDFAFLLGDSGVDFNEYGSEAVIFRTSGVLVLHYGDEQRQVIFWGPNVKSFIPVVREYGDWAVYGNKGQILMSTSNPSEIADWATNNLPQYRKQIMTGKNGYIPKRSVFDKEKNKYVREPYPIYKNESVKKYLTLLKEEVALDGSTEDNPYEKRWKTEREALKNFVANYGKLMQSREDNKMGRLYKVYYDETMSNLIGYNYCICVQWDELTMKPKSTVYIRALDKFTPFIRRNLQFDTRGRDNMRGTYDDTGY